MRTPYGELTYCTNIHSGESWDEHFDALKQNLPGIKKRICGDKDFGIGLRLSNKASLQLQEKEELNAFTNWLVKERCYVFTMNGFPYGGFHNTIVKDKVHAPDWTTTDRVAYTIRLSDILAALLPPDREGGISTSPLSYKYWHSKETRHDVFENTTQHILEVVEHLIYLHHKTGKVLHLDIEPEPDGLLESGPEFIEWYERYLLPMGIPYLQKKTGHTPERAKEAITKHVRLCYDICHFAVGYENHNDVIRQLKEKGIKVGKIQISAALKAQLGEDQQQRALVINAFKPFNEPTYLHQVVALQQNNTLKRYPDLGDALKKAGDPSAIEWRSHFHVPLFIGDYGELKSTQEDIKEVLSIHRRKSITEHLEIETYTWEVLPEALKLPLSESIIREMEWVKEYLDSFN